MKYLKLIILIASLFLIGCNSDRYIEARDKNGQTMYDQYGRRLYYYGNVETIWTNKGIIEVDRNSGDVIFHY